jgi:hypothetical protein
LSLICFTKCRLKVQTKGGVQSVTTNIAQINPGPIGITILSYNELFSDRLSSIIDAVQALYMGDAVQKNGWYRNTRPTNNQPSFLNTTYSDIILFDWGDVLKGIEEISHNVTAGLLMLDLGTTNSNCSFDQQDLVYQYSSFMLWVPYGVSN